MPPRERAAGGSTTRRGIRVSEHIRRAWGESQSINRHPLFPAIVALWCGALFGVASIIVSPALIEGVVVMLGIDKVIPMAAPPLGATTRILLALLMTGIGAAAGLLIGRRFAAAPAEPKERRRRTVPVAEERRKSRIVLARKDRSALSQRRGSFAAEPADDAERAPVPGREPQILSVTEFDLDGFEEADEVVDAPAQDLGRIPASFVPRPPAGAQVFVSSPDGAASEPGSDDEASAPGSLFDSYSREIAARAGQAPAREATIVQPPVPGFMLLSSVGAQTAPTADGEEDEGDEPLIDGSVEAFLTGEEDVAADAPQPSEILESEAFSDGPDAVTAAERIASAELDALSPVELLERLALVMARRREQARLAAEATVAEPVVEDQAPESPAFSPLPFEPVPFRPVEAVVEAEPAPEPAPTPAPPPVPLGLRPVSLRAMTEDDEDDALPAYIPPRHIGLTPSIPRSAAAEEDGEDEENRVLEEGYSSLLDLSRPLPRLAAAEESGAAPDASAPAPFGRPEGRQDAPVPLGERRFDAPARPDPEETEQRLREALATLQRMSGAA